MIGIKFKRIVAMGVASILAMQLTIPAFATSGSGYSTVILTTEGAEEEIAHVIVPAEIRLNMDSSGVITVPDGLKIINNGTSPVETTKIEAQALGEWKATAYSDDFSQKETDTKEFAFELNNDQMDATGRFNLTDGAWIIQADSNLEIDMQVKVPMQTSATEYQLAKIKYTFQVLEGEVEIKCPECLNAVTNANEHKLDCGHYSCDGDDLNHDNANCNTDGHYSCDGLEHTECNICGNSLCTGTHGEDICGTIEKTTLNVNYANGLMLPGSTNTATFKWTTNVENNALTALESSNPEIAEASAIMSLALDEDVEDEQSVTINAKARGTTTITGTLASGEKASFVVEVSELQNNTGSGDDAPSGEVDGAEDLSEGDSISTEDITITLPVLNPDGTEKDIELTPDSITGGESLTGGENEITATVNVNGTTINITIIINIEAKNPSNGLIMTVADANANGWTFESYDDGLQITGFENVNFTNSISVPEQIGDFKVLSVGDSVFQGESNLKTINIPDTVTRFGANTFNGCTNLSSLNIPTSLSSIGDSAFSGCSSLEHIELHPGVSFYYYRKSSYTNSAVISSSFTGYSGEVTCYLTDYYLNNTVPNSASGSSYQLKYKYADLLAAASGAKFNIIIEDGVTALSYDSFGNSRGSLDQSKKSGNIASIHIPASMTNIGTSLGGLPLESITLDPQNESYTLVDGVLYTSDLATLVCFPSKSNIKSYVIPATTNTIEAYAFYNATNLLDVEIPDGVTTISAYTFGGTNLSSIVIPTSVTTIALYAFEYAKTTGLVCYKGTEEQWGEIYIRNCTAIENARKDYDYTGEIEGTLSDDGTFTVADGVTTVGTSAFYKNSNIKSVILPDSVTTIEDYAFIECTSLESIKLSNNLTTMGKYALSDCTALKSVSIPSSLTSIPQSAFYGCTELSSVEIPNTVTTIGNSAFYGSGLTSVTLPDSITTIGNSAFSRCGLESVTLPDSITEIGSMIFDSCTNLESIIIPATVTDLKYRCLAGCTGLASIKYKGTEAQWNAITFASSWNNGTENYTITYDYTE